MKLLIALALLGSSFSIDYPIPEKFQHGAVFRLHMVDTQKEINDACGEATKGQRKLGCETGGGELVTGNPCYYPEVNDRSSYAHLMCHEKAHINGWLHKP